MKRIVICGGHLTPALALIDELKNQKDLEIIFFGRKYSTQGSQNVSAEYKQIKNLNIKFVNIVAGKLTRKFSFHSIIYFLKIPLGFKLAFMYLLIYRPKIIVGFGGYISLPVIFAGWLLGIDSLTHEQASIPGLANKINSLFVKKIFITWVQTKKYFPQNKTNIIGNLTRDAIFTKNAKSQGLKTFLEKSKNLIFIGGGNQGSHFINQLTFKNLKNLSDYQIVHQIGTANYKGDHQKSLNIKSRNYFPVEYLNGMDFGAVLNSSRFYIGRSGANTVWDLASLNKPAIFIPLPHAASNEQWENAKLLDQAGSAIIINQDSATEKKFTQTINELKNSLSSYELKAKQFAKSLPKDAAVKLKKEILKLIA